MRASLGCGRVRGGVEVFVEVWKSSWRCGRVRGGVEECEWRLSETRSAKK